MARVITYARACNAVYDEDPKIPAPWKRIAFKKSTGGLYGAFQGAAFTARDEVIVAFKGTNSAGDAVADAKLTVGMNTHQYAQAAAFLDTVPVSGKKVSVCGHSLGGAIAQIIGNRHRLPFITFNAPGVGLISRNLGEVGLTLFGTAAIRTVGTMASAIRHPHQALQDAGSVFHRVQGVNIRLGKDVVGCVGVHYGPVIEIPYSGGTFDVGTKHKMTTMLTELETSPYRNRRLDALV